MIQKMFRMEESDIDIIEEVKVQLGFRSEAEALRYMIRSYGKEQRKETGRIDAMLRSIEENEEMILDALNTILIEKGIGVCQPVCLRESTVFTKSKEYRKERLANLKEKSDYKKQRRGDKTVPLI